MQSRKNKLGCCGYDELAEKPPTTKPFGFANIKPANIIRKPDGAGVTRRITSMGSSVGRYPIVNLEG